MNIGNLIFDELKNQGRKKVWLAEKIGIPNSTLSDKIKKDTFSAEELIKLSIFLDIDLEYIKEKVLSELSEKIKV